MGDKFDVRFGKGFTYVGGEDHWDVTRLTCGIRGGIDVDGDQKVDIIDCASNKKIVRDPKFTNAAKAFLDGRWRNDPVDVYEEPATAEELAFVQKKFDEGWSLAQKRWGEIHKAFREGLMNMDERGIHYRYGTRFEPAGDEAKGPWAWTTSSAFERRREGLPISRFNSDDKDLILRVSDPALVAQIQPMLDRAVDEYRGVWERSFSVRDTKGPANKGTQ